MSKKSVPPWSPLLLGAVAVWLLAGELNSFTVRGYVDGAFERSPVDDIGSHARAYRSTDPPTTVATTLTGSWTVGRGCVDASGVYLRYASETVVILHRPHGSLILIEPTTTASARYQGHVADCW